MNKGLFLIVLMLLVELTSVNIFGKIHNLNYLNDFNSTLEEQLSNNSTPQKVKANSPTVVISTTSASTTSDYPIPLTITFSSPVTGFTSDDITVGNATLADFTGSGATYTANLVPAAQSTSATVGITASIAAGVAQDASTSEPTLAATPLSITFAYPVQVSGAVSNNDYFCNINKAEDAMAWQDANVNDVVIKLLASVNESYGWSWATLGSKNWKSLTIYPTVSGCVIYSNIGGAPISFNNAKRVTVDGRVNQSGAADLQIINESQSAGSSVVEFAYDSEYNTVRYCNLKGNDDNYLYGVAVFKGGNDASQGGNNYNTISNCNITTYSSSVRLFNAVFSSAQAAKPNIKNKIISNNFYNTLSTTSSESYSIHLEGYSGGWQIDQNSFYETAAINTTAGSSSCSPIYINTGANGSGFRITNNFIGGQSAQCVGGAFTIYPTSASNPDLQKPVVFTPIYVNAGTDTISTIQGNTIKNISTTNTSSATPFYGIKIAGGNVHVGNSTGNTIGSATSTGSVLIGTTYETGSSTVYKNATAYGIYIGTTGTVDCRNNTIGSIVTQNTAGNSCNFIGIYKSATAGTTDIRSNIIGSETIANSIYAGNKTVLSESDARVLCGVFSEGSGAINISDNTIANLKNGSTSTSSTLAHYAYGIYSVNGTNTISTNTIHDLSVLSTNAVGDTISVGGIILKNATPKTVTGNSIYNLSNLSDNFTGTIAGLLYNGDTGSNNVSANYIHSLNVSAASTNNSIFGIKAASGAATYSNNIVSITSTSASGLYGIYDTGAASQNSNYFFNTVHVSGSQGTGALNSYAFYSAAANNTRDIRNNIFFNRRSTTGGSGKHYAIYCNYSGTANLTIDYNNYWVSGTGGVVGCINSTDKSSLELWKSATSQDANSLNTEPYFVNALSGVALDCSPNVTLAGVSGTGITTDYTASTRATTPTIGALEPAKSVEVWIGGVLQGTYPQLKPAFDAINAGTHTGAIDIRIKNNTLETATASLNASGSGSANYSTISIYPITTGVSITGAKNVLPLTFNGADNVTIDGRLHSASGTLTGSTVDLKLSVTEALDHVSVTNGGSGYTTAPTVVFTPTNGGSGATATATLSGNSVYSIEITNAGSGYLTPPVVSFSGGGGSGATALANLSSKGTIVFDQNAQNNTVKYCRIEGAVQSDFNGTIAFLTGTAVNGNGGNTISNNVITNNGILRPQNSIISHGSTTYPNTENIITNNEFKDFFALLDESHGNYNESRGIYIVESGASNSFGTTGWTITGNSFYETTSLSPSTATKFYAIKIGKDDGSVGGIGYTIEGNYIGGSAAQCGGSAFTKTSSANNGFSGITLNLASGTPASSVQNNTIKNINWSNSGGVVGNVSMSWTGIEVGRGNVNIGTTTGNKIGDNTSTGSVTVTGGGIDYNGSKVCGIQLQWQATVNCQNNTIGSITTANSEPLYANHFYGIYNYSNNATTISNNIIGSASVANSINATSPSQNHDQHVYGILCASNSGSTPGSCSIANNTIAHLTNGCTSTTGNNTAYINGIRSEKSSSTLTDNVIHDLSIGNANDSYYSNSSACGIVAIEGAQYTISGNTIYNLKNTYATFNGSVTGLYVNAGAGNNVVSENTIYGLSVQGANATTADVYGLNYNAGTGSNTVCRNFIHSLSAPYSTVADLFGININSGATTFSNNIVSIGGDYRSTIYGIYETGNSSNNNNLYFNTVSIGGSLMAGASNHSYCLYSNSSSNSRNFRNNIFSNVRSTTGGSGLHYAAWFNYGVSTNLTLDYNDYYVSGTGGVLGRYNNNDVTSLPLIAGFDSNSRSINPVFANGVSTNASDYSIGVDLVGSTETGITLDYAANGRSTEYPAIGAWERAMTNRWTGTNSSDWGTKTNWSLNLIPLADRNIEFDTAPHNNCVMDKDYAVNDITNPQSTYNLITNGHKLTVKGNLNFTNGAQIDASAVSSTVEFAGSQAQTIPAGAFVGNNVYNLSINNTNNLTFNGSLNLLNTVTSTAGKLDAMTNSPTICYAGTAAQFIDSIPFLNGETYNLTIDNAAGVSLSNDFVVDHLLTVNSGKALIIPTARKLNVLGTITNNAGTSGILIKSGSGVANGTLIFHNTVDNPVYATVEMFSKAYYDPNGNAGSKYKWQYFGIPLRSVDAVPTFNGSYVRQYNEPGLTAAESWVSLNDYSVLSPFTGYEITQTSAKTISFKGILENGDKGLNLTYNSGSYYKGLHIVSNPYTAAIDIKEIGFTNMEAAVYLYNTGSHDDWNNNSGVTTPGTSPGQYVVAPKNTAGLAGIPGQIPSMQGFMVAANSGGGTLSIQYSSTGIKNTAPQRARKVNVIENNVFTTIDVKGLRYSDKMWLFTNSACRHTFDNGWDGFKMFGSAMAPQIYAMEADGNYQINAVDNIDNTDIGFQAGEDTNYTLTFNHQNLGTLYSTLYLVDLHENKTIDISQSGTTYTFTSTSAPASQKRFKIITSANISTESIENQTSICSELRVYNSKKTIHIENATGQSGDLTLYDAVGRILDKIPFSANKHIEIPTQLNGVHLGKVSTPKKTVVVPLVLF